MRASWAIIVAAITLPACSVAKPIGPITDAASPPDTLAPSLVTPIRPGETTCDAGTLTWLIGRSRNEIPVPVDPARRRVACSRCPVTEDYRPDRTDILYDAVTGLVTSVKCG